jgi:hypothetical protein
MFLGISQIDALAIPFETAPGPHFVRQFTTYLAAVLKEEPGSDAATFLRTYYLPYFREMHDRKHIEPFIYYVFRATGLPGIREWLIAHPAEMDAFMAWDKAFQWR